MARALRSFEPGASFHVFQRGNNYCDVFKDDDDHDRFLDCVRRAAAHFNIPVHGFALMKTHYHLVVTTNSVEGLPRTVKQFGGEYVQYFNRKYERIGTLWAGRYHAVWIRDDDQVLTCLRYVDRNPVAAKLVESPGMYRWSSYRAHAFGMSERWLVEHPTFTALGATESTRRAMYRSLCGPV